MDNETIDRPAIETSIAEYSPTAAGLADLAHRFKNVVFDVSTIKGDKEARAARLELVRLRTGLEAKRKELKAPALERSRLIDAEAKRITDAILLLEEPIDAQIRAADEKREAERQARAESDRLRILRHTNKIAEIRAAATGHGRSSSAILTLAVEQVGALVIDKVYEEWESAAQQAKDETLATLNQLLCDAVARECEGARLREEAKRLERVAQYQNKLHELRSVAAPFVGRPSDLIECALKAFEAEVIDPANWAEFYAQAVEARDAAVTEMKRLLAAAVEAERIAAEQAIESQRLADQRREQDRQEAEARKAREQADADLRQRQEAAAAEQRRLDAEAAERRRAEEERHEAERMEAERAADRVRRAAPLLLDALVITIPYMATLGTPEELAQCNAAIAAATEDGVLA